MIDMRLTDIQLKLICLTEQERFENALNETNKRINERCKKLMECLENDSKKIREKFSLTVLNQLFDIMKFIPKPDGSFHIILPGTNKHLTIVNDGKGALHVTDEEAKIRGEKNCHHRFLFQDLIVDLIDRFKECIVEYSFPDIIERFPQGRIIIDRNIEIESTKKEKRKSREKNTIIDLGISSKEDLILKTGIYTQEQIERIKVSEKSIDVLKFYLNRIGLPIDDINLCDHKLMIINIPEMEYLFPKILSDDVLSLFEQYVGVYAVEKINDKYILIRIVKVIELFFKSEFLMALQPI